MKLPTNDTVLSQKVLSNVDENSKLSRYKIVNLFYDSNTSIDTSFYLHIQNLGTILKLNPTKIIELIGYSSLLESNDDALALALQRASSIRKYLIMTGADPNQIRIRGLSNIKPIYPDENEYYQTIMNRRVECRWIDPALFPYEIRAEKVYTEQEALTMIEKWEKKMTKKPVAEKKTEKKVEKTEKKTDKSEKKTNRRRDDTDSSESD